MSTTTDAGNTILPALIGASTAILTLAGNEFLRRFTKRRDDRLKCLRDLQGIRVIIHQDVITRSEALVHMAYHEARVKYYAKHKELTQLYPHLDFDEAKRWSLKGEQWVDNLTNDQAELCKILSDLSVLFRKDTEIQKEISDFLKTPRSPSLANVPNDDDTLKAIDNWHIQTMDDLVTLASTLYDRPLAKIISLVKPKIK